MNPLAARLAAKPKKMKRPAYTGRFAFGAGIGLVRVAEEGFEPPTKGL